MKLRTISHSSSNQKSDNTSIISEMPKAYLENPNFGQRQASESEQQGTGVAPFKLQNGTFVRGNIENASGKREHRRRNLLKTKLSALWNSKSEQHEIETTKPEEANHKRHHIRFWKNKVKDQRSDSSQNDHKNTMSNSKSLSPISNHNVFDTSALLFSPTPTEPLEQGLMSLINESCTVIFRPIDGNDEHDLCSCIVDDHCSFEYSPSPTAPLNIFGPRSRPASEEASGPCIQHEESCRESFSFTFTPTATVGMGMEMIGVPESPVTTDSGSRLSLRNSADSALHGEDSLTPLVHSPTTYSPVAITARDVTEEDRWIVSSLKEYCSTHLFGKSKRANRDFGENHSIPKTLAGQESISFDAKLLTSSSRSGRSFFHGWRHLKE